MNIKKPIDSSAMFVALDALMAADLTLQKRAWYIRTIYQFGWTKLERRQKIDAAAYLGSALDFSGPACYTKKNSNTAES